MYLGERNRLIILHNLMKFRFLCLFSYWFLLNNLLISNNLAVKEQVEQICEVEDCHTKQKTNITWKKWL